MVIHAINRPSLITSCKTVPGISDHEAVLTCSLLNAEFQPVCKQRVYV